MLHVLMSDGEHSSNNNIVKTNDVWQFLTWEASCQGRKYSVPKGAVPIIIVYESMY